MKRIIWGIALFIGLFTTTSKLLKAQDPVSQLSTRDSLLLDSLKRDLLIPLPQGVLPASFFDNGTCDVAYQLNRQGRVLFTREICSLVMGDLAGVGRVRFSDLRPGLPPRHLLIVIILLEKVDGVLRGTGCDLWVDEGFDVGREPSGTYRTERGAPCEGDAPNRMMEKIAQFFNQRSGL